MGGFQAEEWQIFLKVTLAVMLKWFEGSKVEATIIVQAWYNGGLDQSSDIRRLLEAVRFVLLFWNQNQWDLQMCHGRERRLLPFVDFYESFRCVFMYVQVCILSFSIYFTKCIMLHIMMWAFIYSSYLKICMESFWCHIWNA